MRLSEIPTGQEVVIVKVLGYGAFCKRIIEMGFVRGKRVKVLLNAPLKDPVKYKILDYEVSLRRSEAALIEVVTPEEASDILSAVSTEVVVDEDTRMQEAAIRSGKVINIALVGNPNCGKTTLFNVASGAHEHVGNYSGVTVDVKEGHFDYKGYRFNIADLPGTYSLSAYSPEELYVRRYIIDKQPDVIVNIEVASNLERNLFLTTELIDMDLKTVVALNMYDELEASGAKFDYDSLGKMVGVPMIPIISRTGWNINALFDTIIRVHEGNELTVRHVHVNHGVLVEKGITVVKDAIKEEARLVYALSPRYLAIKLLERDKEIEKLLADEPCYDHWIALRDEEAQHIEETVGDSVETVISQEKYGFVSGALRETFMPGKQEEFKATHLIDAVVTHRLFGFPIFLVLLWIMFWATFVLGQYPMDWIDAGVGALSEFIDNYMAEGPLKDLLIDGVIGGVGGVIVFLPQILILYFFISFMEDSGYLARAAFIMDKLLHKAGLHGKSFSPLLTGFGCNVPAIMATRTIESRSSRLITILITPFMSCSARYPVYVLLIGTFFSAHAGLVFMAIYLLGIVVAVLTARLLRGVYFKKDETPFVMELPPYRIPTAKAVVRHMWAKGEQYLKKMGGIILIASIIIWFLSYFPRPKEEVAPETTVEMATLTPAVESESLAVEGTTEDDAVIEMATLTPAVEAGSFLLADEYYEEELSEEEQATADAMKNSYLGRFGQFIEPVMRPLGFNWKVDIALLAGVGAKEIVVSTMGVLYAGDSDLSEEDNTLRERISAPNPETGKPDFTPLVALSFMVFVLLYFPCWAGWAAIVRETGSWVWGVFSIVYNTAVAWILAFVVYNVGKLFM